MVNTDPDWENVASQPFVKVEEYMDSFTVQDWVVEE